MFDGQGNIVAAVQANDPMYLETIKAALTAATIAGYKPPRPANPPRPLQYVKIIQVPITAEMYHDLVQESKTLGVSLAETVRRRL
jgi:hypothetical protein